MINSLEKINLGGVDQWVLIKSKNQENPIIIFLHGGPGFPIMPFHQYFQRPLEERFTVVQWDQRGAGKSFSSIIPSDTMTLEQILSDAVELIHILIKRFNQEKVYIVGHSWGSIVGIHLIKAFPNIIHGFIGIGQVVDYQKSIGIYYDFAVNSAKLQNCDDLLEQLNEMGRPPFDGNDKINATMKIVEKLGGGLHNFVNFRDIAKDCVEYTEQDIRNVSNGMDFSGKYLWDTVLKSDFLSVNKNFDVPIYLFNGIYDYQTPNCLVEEFYYKLSAPKKRLVVFENSAHFPFIEEPAKFCFELVKILDEE
jgi:pimeloyl-ACP methyl ester carboxylesterase